MKFFPVAATALFAAAPAFAGSSFLIDFEKNWDYSNGDVNGYYAGGAAADSSTGPNRGVSFVGVSGLSNDASFTYYLHAPSMVGTAYAHDTAIMNVAGGVNNALSFFYSSPSAVAGALKAFSGLNGSGILLGSYDLAANDLGGALTESGNYAGWSASTFAFNGIARSFDLTASAGVVGFDNISAVPEPESFAMLLSGLGLLAFMVRRKKQQSA